MTRVTLGLILVCATAALLGCVKMDAPLWVVINETKGDLTDMVVVAGESGATGLAFRHARLEPGESFVLGARMPELSIRTIKCLERSFEPQYGGWPCCWNEVSIVRLKDAKTATLEYYFVGGDPKVDRYVREYRASLPPDP